MKLMGKSTENLHEGKYEIVSGRPRNYRGRTGITGRGCLGRWGPNHAADPVVTRWKVDASGNFEANGESSKKILQFVSIKRRDCGEWAIPGGMVDPGEKVTSTLLREFMEEAMNSLEMNDVEIQNTEKELKELFDKGNEIYSGYVDDPRNTDNAWMETVAYNFHENNREGLLYKLPLTAGDDAESVKWVDLSQSLTLYASHKEILQKVVENLDAHW
ncbi:ADP-ribose pyrophosphatase, mitochondrial [Armadillidium nasatum]|uniref:ADP-ribose pyrophosphatase, mitochondrial n=1 Tax=Armadillidium nasatum TaxID=96803 RepID=A0A5N5SR04_9CRUS|nr:ADP-ribose pyrophosphatase, mitochondrial [Armadillidium nasatum]